MKTKSNGMTKNNMYCISRSSCTHIHVYSGVRYFLFCLLFRFKRMEKWKRQKKKLASVCSHTHARHDFSAILYCAQLRTRGTTKDREKTEQNGMKKMLILSTLRFSLLCSVSHVWRNEREKETNSALWLSDFYSHIQINVSCSFIQILHIGSEFRSGLHVPFEMLFCVLFSLSSWY